MATVGAFDAKTHFSALLDKVEAGEEIVITRHGRPVARLVPEHAAEARRTEDIASRLKQLRRRFTLDGISWKELRDEGRK